MKSSSLRRARAWLGPLLVVFWTGAGAGARADDGHLRDLSTSTAACLSCHPFHGGHPVDIDYQDAVRARRHDLRVATEVVRRGVFLPGGSVVCFSCHDANSRWKSRIVIPPGSKVTAMVIPGDPRTYDPALAPTWAFVVEEALVRLPVGYAVSPKPLCLACHALD